jgi:small subunit ribosomal protein S27e
MTSKFVKVKCEKCKNEQMVFVRAASRVKCLVCGEVLAEPTGGKARLNVKVLGQEKEKPAKREPEEKVEE